MSGIANSGFKSASLLGTNLRSPEDKAFSPRESASRSQDSFPSTFKSAIQSSMERSQSETESSPAEQPLRSESTSQQGNKSPAPSPVNKNSNSINSKSINSNSTNSNNTLSQVTPEAKPAGAPHTQGSQWESFAARMEEEFGIAKEDLQDAFDSLSTDDWSDSASLNAEKILLALGFTGTQAIPAAPEIIRFIETQSSLVNEASVRTANSSSWDRLVQSLTPKETAPVLLQKNNPSLISATSQFQENGKSVPLDKPLISDDFFTTKANAKGRSVDSAVNASLLAEMTPVQGMPVTDMANSFFNVNSAQSHSGLMGDSLLGDSHLKASLFDATGASLEPLNGFDANEISGDALAGFSDKTEFVGLDVLGPNAGMLTADKFNFNINLNSDLQPSSQSLDVSDVPPQQTLTMDALLPMMRGKSSDSGSFEKEGQETPFTDISLSSNSVANASTQNGTTEFQATLGSMKDVAGVNASASASAAQLPLADIVKHAQLQTTKGGGEMQVTLNPEGLGEVAMKVNVEQGKVNVQIATESDETKKIIEQALSDLKNHLTSNQLQVDSIKVDTSTNLKNQLEQQQQEAQRQFAHQTMEQFRQDHQGQRRSFLEMPGAKLYKGQGESLGDVAAPTITARRDSQRRLDLVA